MRHLNVFISGQLAGVLELSEQSHELVFRYSKGYSGPDLSVAMPFHPGRDYPDRIVRTWFTGLLPDSADVRANMSKQCGGGRSAFALLSRFGMELPGAVQVVADDDIASVNRAGVLVDITREEIGRRLGRIMNSGRLGEDNIWMSDHERWSLGGAQPKLALYRRGGVYSECRGSAASNVIVKPGVADAAFGHQALCEGMSMRLAKRVGLNCADVSIENFGGVDAVVVARYDRVSARDGSVLRVHQEDFCQALSVYPDQKYPSEGGPDSASIMVLLGKSTEAEDRMRFFDALVFNHLIAAPDAHGKNYSIVHFPKGRFQLAPLYDVASIAPYMRARSDCGPGDARRPSYRCAMSIGGENRIGRLRKSSIDRFAKLHGLPPDELRGRIEELASKVKENLEPVVDEFASWEGADEIGTLLVARVSALCDITVHNINASGAKVRYIDLGEVRG